MHVIFFRCCIKVVVAPVGYLCVAGNTCACYTDEFFHLVRYNESGMSIVHFKGLWARISNYDVLTYPKNVLILVNSADPDEMPQYGAFHLTLYCLPKYSFRGFPYTKG